MDETTARALATDRVIDITTTGRHTGEKRRIEIWYHRLGDKFYITGTPTRPRGWYANLVANPGFVFHLKQSAVADLTATARPVTDPAERAAVFEALLAPLPDLTKEPGNEPENWIARSPLVQVTFSD